MVFSGYVHKFGDNINTDIIIPARFCTSVDTQVLAKHCMFDLDDKFYLKVKKSDIIIAGKNFGCGSSREAAPIAIKGLGIKCVIAKSFARIFYRNAINIGLLVIESEQLYDLAESGEFITVDVKNNTVNLKNQSMKFNSNNSQIIDEIIDAGGLVDYVNKRLSLL